MMQLTDMNKLLTSAALLLLCVPASAQKKIWVGKSNKTLNFQAHYTYVMPGGDFASRFNAFSGVGGGIAIKTTHNIVYGVEGTYHFGSDLKPTSMLNNLTNGTGFISNSAGFPSEISVGMRGFSVMAKGGWVIPISSSNLNSGFIIQIGGGVVMHKININVLQNDVPSLTQDKIAGYDRYSSGWAANQFVGYWHHSRNRYVNFYVGLDLSQAFTYNRRKFNYDSRSHDTDMHNDYYFGLRFGWMIPRYLKTKNSNDEFIFE